MKTFILKPILGLKSNVAPNDLSLFAQQQDNSAACYCVGGQNFDLNRRRNASVKSYSYQEWSGSATTAATMCTGLFELVGSSATDHIFFDNGYMNVYDSARDPAVIALLGGAVQMGHDASQLYSMIQVGNYLVWSDFGVHTPYAWDNGDATYTELISAGTEFKFRYLEYFQNYIFGAYSDQTNGDIEIRWSGVLPVPITSCEFAAANQLYKPGNDSITGIKKFGSNSCFLYGSDSICSIDYYANYLTPFAIRNMQPYQGAVNHHSIVDTGGRHFLFNKNYGFCEYRGGNDFPYGGRPISYDIENIIGTIDPTYYPRIVGTFSPKTSEIIWSVPLDNSVTNNRLLFYNIVTGNWRQETKVASYVDIWRLFSTLIWDGATLDLADMGIVYWSDFNQSTISSLVNKGTYTVYANTDGSLYYSASEGNDIINFEGYRIEPILNFEFNDENSLLEEIWFSLTDTGPFNLKVSYRGGNTVSECEEASWETLDEIDCYTPTGTVTYLSKFNRYHQIKWGTDYINQKFGVNAIQFKYVPEGKY